MHTVKRSTNSLVRKQARHMSSLPSSRPIAPVRTWTPVRTWAQHPSSAQSSKPATSKPQTNAKHHDPCEPRLRHQSEATAHAIDPPATTHPTHCQACACLRPTRGVAGARMPKDGWAWSMGGVGKDRGQARYACWPPAITLQINTAMSRSDVPCLPKVHKRKHSVTNPTAFYAPTTTNNTKVTY